MLANFPDGLLGIPWLTDRVSLPFADHVPDSQPLLLDQEVARAA